MASLALAFDILARDRGASSTFEKVGRSAETAGDKGTRFGGKMKAAVGVVAGALAAAGIARQLGEIVTAGSGLQQALGGAEAVFKKSFGEINKTAAAAADNLGLSRRQYLELSTVLGAGLKNKGLKDYADQTQKLVGIGADLAAQYGGSTKDAVDALAAAMRGESDPIERYGISLNETAVNAYLAKKGLDDLEGPALDQAKAQARVALITQQSADALGAFGREADTFAGKQQRLSARIENIKERLGTALLPVLTEVSGWFLDKGVPAVERFTKFLTGRLLPGIKGVFDLLFKGDYTGALSKAFGWEEDSRTVEALFRVRDAVRGAWERVKELWSWVQERLWPALRDGYDRIMPGLKKAIDIVTGGVGGTNAEFGSLADVLVDKVIPFIAQLVSVWLPYIATQIRAVIEVVKVLWKAFETWGTIVSRVVTFILERFAAVTRVGARMLDALSKVPGFGWAKDAARKLREAADEAAGLATNLRKITDKNVTVKVKFTSSGQVQLAPGVSVDVGQYRARAGGGPVRKNMPYAVGDNPDGSWNRTTELFVPSQSGHIFNQRQLAAMMTGQGASSPGRLHPHDIAAIVEGFAKARPVAVISSEAADAALAVGL